MKVCKNCNITLEKKWNKFCSRECYWDWKKGRSFTNSGSFKKGQRPWNAGTAQVLTCKECGVEYKKSGARGKYFCSTECVSKNSEWKEKVVKNLLTTSKDYTQEIREKLSKSKIGKAPIWMSDKYKKKSAIKKMSKSKKGAPSPNKGRKYPQLRGKNNCQWKADDVSYRSLHKWVRNHKDANNGCSFCGVKDLNRFHMANISGEYRRDVDDYIELCPKCHKKFDMYPEERGNYVCK